MSEMQIYTGDLFYLKGGGVGACIDDTPTEDGYRFLRVDKACVQPFIVYAWPDFDRLPRPTISLRTGGVTYDPELAEEPLTNRCDNPTMGPITRDAAPDAWCSAPPPVLTLRPPVDAADLARTLVSLRPGKRLVVTVDGADIVVREAGE